MFPYIRKEIQNLKAYHLSSYPDLIKLNQNEMASDIPGNIKAKVLEKLVRMPWNRYPLPQAYALRQKLARLISWPEEGVLVTNGSNVLIQQILLASSAQGKVLSLLPSFSLYELEATISGAQNILVPLAENFAFPKDEILKKIKEEKPNAIVIANPNAPTGNLFPKEEIKEVLNSFSGLMIVDEAYCHFAAEDLLDELKNFKNLVLLRTLSKAYSLGGIRIGYAVAHPELINEFSKVTLPYCVSALNELVAEVVLDHSEIMETRVAEVKIERSRVYQALLSLPGIKTYPSQTNFIIFQVPDAAKTFNDLVAEGILIRNVSAAPYLPDTLRVSIGKPEENEKFLDVMRKLFY